MRENIIEALTDEAQGLTVSEIAAVLEASDTTTRKTLKALVAEGVLEVTTREGTKGQVFVITPEPTPVEVDITHRTRSDDRDALALELLSVEAITMDELAVRMSAESGSVVTKKLSYQSIWRLSHRVDEIRKVRTGSRVPLWASHEVADVTEQVLAEARAEAEKADAEAKATAKAEAAEAKNAEVTEVDDSELATAAA